MNRLQTAAILTDLVDRMRRLGGWCGETHIQKSVYLTQQLAGVPLGFDFILYKHGPFSFDLRDELTSLRADGLLKLEPQPFPYGPKFQSTESAQSFRTRFPKVLSRHEAAIRFVAGKLARKRVDELERLATALFATVRRPEDEARARAAWIHEVKPHVPMDEALEALDEIESLSQEFHEMQTES